MNVNFNIAQLDKLFTNVAYTKNSQTAENTAATDSGMYVGNGVTMNSMDVTKLSAEEVNESLTSIEEQLKLDAAVAKDNLKALFNKLSGADVVEFGKDGVNLNDMEVEDIVTVVDEIKIMLATYCEDYVPMGSSIDTDTIRQVAGNEGAAQNISSKISEKFTQVDVPDTEDNVTEAELALNMYENLPELDAASKAYLMTNGLEPTIDNVYKACHSAYVCDTTQGISQEDFGSMMSQVKGIIESAGLECNEDTLEDAKWILDNSMPLTEENLLTKQQLDSIQQYDTEKMLEKIADTMAGGVKAIDTLITEDVPVFRKVVEAIKTINNATYEEVSQLEDKGEELTIENLRHSRKTIEEYRAVHTTEQKDADRESNASSYYMTLMETRLVMTAKASISLVVKGIDIDTTKLSELVDMLRQEQTAFLNEELDKNNVGEITEDELEDILTTNNALLAIKMMPPVIIGEVVAAETTVTIEAVKSRYDLYMTTIRPDLGDSLEKAVDSSAEDILREYGYETNGENIKAVSILAANRMDITPDNIDEVLRVSSTLDSLVENMKPQVVLDMIRDNINPMKTDIDVLNEYIQENYDTVQDVGKYSEFLYQLEQKNEITQEEREQYIGIYKMFNIFKKDGGKAIGALIRQGAAINMSNLIAAYKSRRAGGIDEKLQQDTGMAQVSGKAAYYNNLFSSLGKNITPDMLYEASQEKNIEDMTFEEFAQMVRDKAAVQKEEGRAYTQEVVEEYRALAETEESVIRMLTDYELPVTYNNLSAAQLLYNNAEGVFRRIKDNDRLKRILESADSEEALKQAYEEVMTEETIEDSEQDSYIDIKAMQQQNNCVSLIKKMAQSRNYLIPVVEEDQITAINLKVVEDSQDAGRISINLETEQLSKTMAECRVSHNSISMFVVTATSEGRDCIEENKEKIQENLIKLGYEEVRIEVSVSDNVPDVPLKSDEDRQPTNMLYRTAKSIIMDFMEIKAN